MTPDELIRAHLHLPEAAARGLLQRNQTCGCDLEDLIAYGRLGLVDAAQRYREGTGATFATFAFYRINGAIRDGIARMRESKKVGRTGSRRWKNTVPFAANAHAAETEEVDHLGLANLSSAVESLPQELRSVIEGRFFREETCDVVGAQIGKSRGWVSRLERRALLKLRALLHA